MRFVIVGAGKSAIDVARAVGRQPGAVLAGAVGDASRETAQSSFADEVEKLGIAFLPARKLDDPETLQFLERQAPDFIISANNFLIFRQKTLGIPRIATINFHNGPLPNYAGLNPFAWALLLGEKTYGISWHVVEDKIDAGAVLHFEGFDVEPDETSVGMIVKCIKAGTNSFRTSVLPRLMAGDVVGPPQRQELRRYFSGKMLPYDGHLPWWEGAEALDRFVRALSFSPLPNHFFEPVIVTQRGVELTCGRVEWVEGFGQTQPGHVLDTGEEEATIATLGKAIRCSEIRIRNGGAGSMPMQSILRTGEMLQLPDKRSLL